MTWVDILKRRFEVTIDLPEDIPPIRMKGNIGEVLREKYPELSIQVVKLLDKQGYRKDCLQCGECCKNLYWYDRWVLSWQFKTLQLSKVCKFLDSRNKCTQQNDKYLLCKEWFCGAYFREY